MDDDLPGFGDVVGLRRLYRAAVARVRAMDIPEADRRAWLAELQRAWSAALSCVGFHVTSVSHQAPPNATNADKPTRLSD